MLFEQEMRKILEMVSNHPEKLEIGLSTTKMIVAANVAAHVFPPAVESRADAEKVNQVSELQ